MYRDPSARELRDFELPPPALRLAWLELMDEPWVESCCIDLPRGRLRVELSPGLAGHQRQAARNRLDRLETRLAALR